MEGNMLYGSDAMNPHDHPELMNSDLNEYDCEDDYDCHPINSSECIVSNYEHHNSLDNGEEFEYGTMNNWNQYNQSQNLM